MAQVILARLGRWQQSTALRHRGFRFLWTATFLSSTGRWTELVVVGWLTLELTESPLMVGIVSGAKMAGFIAAPFMGVAADRMNRRLLLVMAAAVNLAVSAMMLLLLLTGWLALWHIIALALVGSLTWALDNPARQAFTSDLVGKEDLTNAIALTSVAQDLTVATGPALGGILIPLVGMSGAYGLIAGIYILDIVVLLILRGGERARPGDAESPWRSLVNGLSYVRGHRAVLVMLAMAFLLNLFVASYRYSVLPLFARYVLATGPTGYGVLTSAAGVGALLAGLWVVSLGDFRRRGLLVVAGSLAWPLSLLLFSLSTRYYLSLALVFAAGFTQAITWMVMATLILSNTAPHMRGRVMGLRTGVAVSLPFGNLLVGAAAERWSAPLAQGSYAVAALLIMLVVALLAPGVRRLE